MADRSISEIPDRRKKSSSDIQIVNHSVGRPALSNLNPGSSPSQSLSLPLLPRNSATGREKNQTASEPSTRRRSLVKSTVLNSITTLANGPISCFESYFQNDSLTMMNEATKTPILLQTKSSEQGTSSSSISNDQSSKRDPNGKVDRAKHGNTGTGSSRKRYPSITLHWKNMYSFKKLKAKFTKKRKTPAPGLEAAAEECLTVSSEENANSAIVVATDKPETQSAENLETNPSGEIKTENFDHKCQNLVSSDRGETFDSPILPAPEPDVHEQEPEVPVAAPAPSLPRATRISPPQNINITIPQSPLTLISIDFIKYYGPFVLLFLKFLIDYCSWIAWFIVVAATFVNANTTLTKEVLKRNARKISGLSVMVIYLTVCIVFIFYVYEDERIYATFVDLPPKLKLSSTSTWSRFWLICVTDYVVKFLTIIAKAFVLSLPERLTSFRERGKYYLFIERSSQLYRSVLPFYLWFSFFSNAYETAAEKIVGRCLTWFYCAYKTYEVGYRLKDWCFSFGKMFQPMFAWTPSTLEELSKAGLYCPICRDVFNAPKRLVCSHVFCEECIASWFDRESSCPMCRAQVVDVPFRDGSTTQAIQLF